MILQDSSAGQNLNDAKFYVSSPQFYTAYLSNHNL